MVRVEPQSVDLERWPSLAVPEPGGQAGAVAQALRRSARELGVRLDYPDDSAAGEFDAPARVVLADPEAFWARLAASGVTGLGESFMAGEWVSPDLQKTLGVLVPWIAGHPDCAHPGAQAAREPRGGGLARRRGRRRAPDLEDGLPGDLCALYTDETMSTSGAVFASGARTRTTEPDGTELLRLEAPVAVLRRTDLGDAQRRAADGLLALAGVGESSHVLVAPPGWGELPMRAAERGARVRTVTSSTERLAMLGSRIAAAGLDDAVTLSLGGVDEVTGDWDAVVADEPGAAAGLAGVASVLEVSDRLLRPGGRVVVQTLLAPGAPAPALAELAAWQSAYVSDAAPTEPARTLAELVARHPRLRPLGRLDLSAHHAETVRLWSENFAIRGRDAAALGFDAVYRRMWAFHLAALEARLRRRWVESVQVVYAATDRP